ncbi:33944_t:CDS:2 [Racocetra persica]|uniref:33944_t:CDS:1 n=1 Tax=Racocetra persica TaxID=160502 RepID=A0ACA9PS88_9GLOM|nr:33944_t:CDS:2 [Racocetra persica]
MKLSLWNIWKGSERKLTDDSKMVTTEKTILESNGRIGIFDTKAGWNAEEEETADKARVLQKKNFKNLEKKMVKTMLVEWW